MFCLRAEWLFADLDSITDLTSNGRMFFRVPQVWWQLHDGMLRGRHGHLPWNYECRNSPTLLDRGPTWDFCAGRDSEAGDRQRFCSQLTILGVKTEAIRVPKSSCKADHV